MSKNFYESLGYIDKAMRLLVELQNSKKEKLSQETFLPHLSKLKAAVFKADASMRDSIRAKEKLKPTQKSILTLELMQTIYLELEHVNVDKVFIVSPTDFQHYLSILQPQQRCVLTNFPRRNLMFNESLVVCLEEREVNQD